MRVAGFLVCIAIMIWIMDMAAGISVFIDLIALALVFVGGLGYALAKGAATQSRPEALVHLGNGWVYWGWLGLLVGCVGIAAHLEELSQLGPALSIAFLTLLYGYFGKWILLSIVEDA